MKRILLLMTTMMMGAVSGADGAPSLTDALAQFRPTSRSCVSSTVAVGRSDQVLIEITCAGKREMEVRFPERTKLMAAVSLVTERFAELGFANRCSSKFHRVPFSLSPRAISVICFHQR